MSRDKKPTIGPDSMSAREMAREISWRLLWIGQQQSPSFVLRVADKMSEASGRRREHELWRVLDELRHMVKLQRIWPPCPSYN